MPQQHIDASTLKSLEQDFSDELDSMREQVLATYAKLAKIPRSSATVHSFHGKIGSKNNEYTDAIRTQFSDPDDFIAKWLKGLCDSVADDKADGYERAATRLARLLKNKVIRDYTFKFLTRNFYRNLVERTRAKPRDLLWQLWFGDNKMTWGLFIAPAFRKETWTNDKSEIRRAKYDYWTVGHVLATGIIDPEVNEILKFSSIDALKQFYLTVLRRCSASIYEKEIVKKYIEFLHDSDSPDSEPFLIPELRFAGREVEHKHRLDFSILNSHTMQFVGFEISPSKTHMHVKGIKKRTQTSVNQELADKWTKESDKRNEYFATYGITTITFTDKHLKDIDSCFGVIADHLSQRAQESETLAYQIAALDALNV